VLLKMQRIRAILRRRWRAPRRQPEALP
jgi:hypothetical protein